MVAYNRLFVTESEAIRQNSEYTTLRDFQLNYEKKRLAVDIDSTRNIIYSARQNKDTYWKFIEILKHDYLLIGHKNYSSIFMKRTEYFPEKIKGYEYLKRHKNVLYTYHAPEAKKISPSLPQRLLVLFSHMNGTVAGYNNNNIITRTFNPYFLDIQRSLVKNVHVLRLGDLTLSHGSYYHNTQVFPDYEEQIQELITSIRKRYNISNENTILYGGSKGGSGALLHAAIGDYHAILGDPIINLSFYNFDRNDYHFVQNFLPLDLTDNIIKHCKGNKNTKYIFGHKAQKLNYGASCHLASLSNGVVKIVDLSGDSKITQHPHITSNSVPEQITLMNLMFDGQKIIGQNI